VKYDKTQLDKGAALLASTKPRAVSTYTFDPIIEFKKGIRHDALAFSIYKDKKQWDTWEQSTLAKARAQDVAEILDPSYVLTTDSDIALFDKKQEFMYAVFKHTLQTDQGKAYVWEHEKDFDAQKVYASLQAYSIMSIQASLDTSKILSYITSVQLADGSWKGGDPCIHPQLAGPDPEIREKGEDGRTVL
jgi:hypothetical protein